MTACVCVWKRQGREREREINYHLRSLAELAANSSGIGCLKILADTTSSQIIHIRKFTEEKVIRLSKHKLQKRQVLTLKSAKCPSRTDAFWWEQFLMISGSIFSKYSIPNAANTWERGKKHLKVECENKNPKQLKSTVSPFCTTGSDPPTYHYPKNSLMLHPKRTGFSILVNYFFLVLALHDNRVWKRKKSQ